MAVGTIFKDLHLPLTYWLAAIYLMCASRKGISAHQPHRLLRITYKSAWFMAHRIRYAMMELSAISKLTGIVGADETCIGGKARGQGKGSGTDNNIPVISLVERKGQRTIVSHNCENPWLFRDTLIKLLGSGNLEYQKLIAS